LANLQETLLNQLSKLKSIEEKKEFLEELSKEDSLFFHAADRFAI